MLSVKIKLTAFCMHLTLFNQVQVQVHKVQFNVNCLNHFLGRLFNKVSEIFKSTEQKRVETEEEDKREKEEEERRARKERERQARRLMRTDRQRSV